MLPVKTLDKINCLESLVGVRSECADISYPFYVEDIEGVDIKALAAIANVNSPSGVSMGKDLVNKSAREMMADIELLLGSGYSMQNTFGDLCGACDYIGFYQANSGVKVSNTILSNYSILRISSIQILTNYTGAAVLVLDDGENAKQFDVNLIAGTIIPATLTYETLKKTVKIYFTDTAITLAQIKCSTTSGCGCGGASNRAATDTIVFSGLLAGNDNSVQYGFKVCANVSCSSDLLVCDLIRQTPLIFARALYYKTAQKYFAEGRNSTRINRNAGTDNEHKETMQDFYSSLYNKDLRNTNRGAKSIKTVLEAYLKQRKDKCIVCDAIYLIAGGTG